MEVGLTVRTNCIPHTDGFHSYSSVQEVDRQLKELLATAEPTFTDIDNLIAR